MRSLARAVEAAVAALDFEAVREKYWEQNEFVFIEGVLLNAGRGNGPIERGVR